MLDMYVLYNMFVLTCKFYENICSYILSYINILNINCITYMIHILHNTYITNIMKYVTVIYIYIQCIYI